MLRNINGEVIADMNNMKRILTLIILFWGLFCVEPTFGNTKQDEEKYEYIVGATTLEVFEEASVESKVIGKLKCGDIPNVTCNDLDIPMKQIKLSDGTTGYICSAGTRINEKVSAELAQYYTPEAMDANVQAAKEFMKNDYATKHSKNRYYRDEESVGVGERINEWANERIGEISDDPFPAMITCTKWTAISLLALLLLFSFLLRKGFRVVSLTTKVLLSLGIIEVAYALIPKEFYSYVFGEELFATFHMYALYRIKRTVPTRKIKKFIWVSLVLLAISAGITIYVVGINAVLGSLVYGILNLICGVLCVLLVLGIINGGERGKSRNDNDDWDYEATVGTDCIKMRKVGPYLEGSNGKTYFDRGDGTVEEV